MPTAKSRVVPKNFRLDPVQITRAKKALAAKTETETIVRALDYVIAEAERNRSTAEANEKFLKSGIEIRDASAAWPTKSCRSCSIPRSISQPCAPAAIPS